MTIVIRPPTDDEWPAVCRVDGRSFGTTYSPERIEQVRPMHDLSRFRVAFDGIEIVAVAGSYALDVTLPGATSVPMGGVTWVSTVATHRRQGLMRRVVGAVHDDIDERGEPLASLSASEGSIYSNIGYGIATRVRVISIDPRSTRLRAEFRTPPGSVRYLEGDDVVTMMSERWSRFRRTSVGEVDRSITDHEFLYASRNKEMGAQSAGFYIVHADGFACYRVEQDWNDGHPRHTLHLIEFVAITPEAHAALWETLLSVDLVGEIRSRVVAIDDPLPFLLEDQRALRTTELNDGIWANLRDPSICFGARTYRTDDRIVVEADGKRWAIEGGPAGGECRAVRTRPDLTTTGAALASLLYGGVAPSTLVRGRQMTARNDDVLRRADVFFTTVRAPHCTSLY
ncbi:MAG: GNAT family N-acetyltransferase [Ilumatobacteraceae bacterium]